MKRLYLSIILGVITIALVVIPSFAREGLGLGVAQGATNSGTGLHPLETQSFSNLKQRADAEITRRVNSLTELIAKINGLKKLPAANKTDLIAKLQTQIDSLNALKIKIDADTDITTLRTDVQSIIQTYRIYALFLPEVRILITADSMNVTSDSLAVLSTKLQTLIASSGATGDTLSNLQNLLTDMQAKIKAANDLYQSVETEVLALTPQGYPGNRTTLMDARSKLRTASADLKTARDDAKQMVRILRSLNKTLNATGSGVLDKTFPRGLPEVKLRK